MDEGDFSFHAPASEELDRQSKGGKENRRRFLMTRQKEQRGGIHGVAVAPPGPKDGKGCQ